MKKYALIIGAGPAGLTAALELLRHSDIQPIVLEADSIVGGISRTVNYQGNRIDIGGHRFFSKSDWVMDWWREILPIQTETTETVNIHYQNKTRPLSVSPLSNTSSDKVMLIRTRLSRIFYLRRFFDYPLKLSPKMLGNLGIMRVIKIGSSFSWAQIFPRKLEKTLEDFLVNRFGYQLYLTFFKDYTEKVWGVPCQEISAEWGAQRIKGLSVGSALKHAAKKIFRKTSSIEQKETNTSLIEKFLYPKLGPGQMWEEVAYQVQAKGGQIQYNQQVIGLKTKNKKVIAVRVLDKSSQEEKEIPCDYAISTMPVRDLVNGMDDVPESIRSISSTLPYRDFITVGLLAKRMLPNNQAESSSLNNMPPDNWIYIQENDVKVGRIQIFNNWSPNMVQDPSKIWVGLEYFCNEGDALWILSDEELKQLAKTEVAKIGMMDESDIEDMVVIRMPKAYPAYFGSYTKFDEVRAFLDEFSNLFLIGRNGMHRYNNQDHSMLSAKQAVENIISGCQDKSKIWGVNVDDEYHEEMKDKFKSSPQPENWTTPVTT